MILISFITNTIISGLTHKACPCWWHKRYGTRADGTASGSEVNDIIMIKKSDKLTRPQQCQQLVPNTDRSFCIDTTIDGPQRV